MLLLDKYRMVLTQERKGIYPINLLLLVIEDAEKKRLNETSEVPSPENNEDNTESSENKETENSSNLQFLQHDPFNRGHQPEFRDSLHEDLTRNREHYCPLDPQSTHYGQQLDHHLRYGYVPEENRYSPSGKTLHQDFHSVGILPRLPNWNFPPVEETRKGWYPPDYDGRLSNPETDEHLKMAVRDANNKKNNTQGDIVVKEPDSQKPIGKLIPRQVRKRKVLPEGLLGQVTETTRDSVNEELRRTAFILGKYIVYCF